MRLALLDPERTNPARTVRKLLGAVALALTASACREAFPTLEFDISSTLSQDFAVVESSLLEGAVWQLNRPIDLTFSQDVDFSTVSGTTIALRDLQGRITLGSFSSVTPRTVRFQPLCPTDELASNGALQPGTQYRLIVASAAGGGVAGGMSVQSTGGQPLAIGYSRRFSTPDSTDPRVLFLDLAPGAPRVRVRGLDGVDPASMEASYVEFGDDPNDVEFLELQAGEAQASIAREVPLNLFSQSSERFAIVLRLNQPIAPLAANLTTERIGIDARLAGTQFRIPTRAELVQNCADGGAILRLEPLGIVPQAAELSIVLRAGFEDLVGESLAVESPSVIRLVSGVAGAGGANEGDGSDEILESFLSGALDPESLEDPTFSSGLPRALWAENGSGLIAAFDPAGGGGPGGDFDWTIRTGQTVLVDTALDQILGGPGGVPSTEQTVVGGVVEVRDLVVEAGGRLIVSGPNPIAIRASGSVSINGLVLADGQSSLGVWTLNTTNFPEFGAAGNAGGGDGGTASFLTSQSTPRGGAGEGAFGVPGLGGEGGETGFDSQTGQLGSEFRRGAGGGGGRLGPDVRYPFAPGFPSERMVRCQTLIGMDAEPGFVGSLDGTGAVSQSGPAAGGAAGPFPFVDSNPLNDFYGTLLTATGEQILGELPSIWAGAGGGAGGDAVASATFPLTPFSGTADEKGAGGGGGGGGVLIQSLGPIVVGPDGSITADGGNGNGGENTAFFDRIGGGSGGGSGGHIVLSSASRIVIEARVTAATAGAFYADDPTSKIHAQRPISALGGQGGVGRGSRCGYGELQRQTQWRSDAIPLEAFEGNVLLPPRAQLTFQQCNTTSVGATPVPEGTVPGGGGDGGPGLVQLHVVDPATQILFPSAAGSYGGGLDPTRSVVPPPVGWRAPADPVDGLVPFIGARSDAYSRWIPLGLARLNPDGTTNPVEFHFRGTDPLTGDVLRDGENVLDEPPIVPWSRLSVGAGGVPAALPSFSPADGTIHFDASGLDAIYRSNPALLRAFALRIRAAGGVAVEFTVQGASPGAASDTLEVTVASAGIGLVDVIAGATSPEVQLVPRHLRVSAGGVADVLPNGTAIRISFDATTADPVTLEPDDSAALSGGDPGAFATDAAALGNLAWDYFRFRVEFDLAVGQSGVDPSVPRPALDLLKIPFRF